jgi:hypothetical protein
MMGGTILAVALGRPQDVANSLGFLGLSGVCVWLTPMWGAPGPGGEPGRRFGNRRLRLLHVLIGAVASALLAWFTPGPAIVSLVVLGSVMLVATLVFRFRRKTRFVIAGLLLLFLIAAAVSSQYVFDLDQTRLTPLGLGEKALVHYSARDAGVVVLGMTIGWLGLGWLLAGMLLSVVLLISNARGGSHDARSRAIVWATGAALAACAALTKGGLFVPSVTLAMAFTWGLLPSMSGAPAGRLSGFRLLLVLIAAMIVLGLTHRGGLPSWMVKSLGGNDLVMHGCAGFVLALALAWLMGSERIRWGLVGIALGVLAGGAGECLQRLVSYRSMQFSDWGAHVIGCLAAVPLYLLCMFSRWCESPDARARDSRMRPG